jgi:hypothetical protein
LSDRFRDIWQQFLRRIESLDVVEYISFKALARCLGDLADKLGDKPARKFPSSFRPGEPNLVVCSGAEMHEMALSFYMADFNKPLPGLDEVLIVQVPVHEIESVF